MKPSAIIAGLLTLFAFQEIFPQTDSLQVWVQRTVTPKDIYYEGARGGDTATVTIRAYASNDTLSIGKPIDVLFLIDDSPSMGYRTAGSGIATTPPISYKQGAYNAAVTFIDRYMTTGTGRVGCMLFDWYVPVIVPFTSPATDPGLVGVKDTLDHEIINSGRFVYDNGRGSRIWNSMDSALDYIALNQREGVVTYIILLTDGEPFWNEPDNATALNRVINRLNTLNAVTQTVGVYSIRVDDVYTDGDSASMIRLADAGGGKYFWTASGLDITSIFDIIGQEIMTAAAIQINPMSTPMFVDVLGPNVHYVPGSFRVITDSSHFIPFNRVSMTLGTVTDYTGIHQKFTFDIDTINVSEVLKIEYKVTAALYEFDYLVNPKIMPLNMYKADDTLNYSRFKYRTYTGQVIEKPIEKVTLRVRNQIDGLHLSTSTNSVVQPDSTGAKAITLNYSTLTTASYGPRDLYSILQINATDTSQYNRMPCGWQFQPNASWSVSPEARVLFTDPISANRNIGVSVLGGASLADQDTLFIRYFDSYSAQWYRDSLSFRAVYFDEGEYYTSCFIADNAASTSPLPDFTLRGNYDELDGYSRLLYAIGYASTSVYKQVSAASWRASAGITLSAAAGGVTRIDSLRLLPRTNTPRSSVDTVLLSYTEPKNGQVFRDTLIITVLDTTDYDTVTAVVITPDSAFRNTSNRNTLYDLYHAARTYAPYAGDAVRFAPLLFDAQRIGGWEKYLGNGSFPYHPGLTVSWYVNGALTSAPDTLFSLTRSAPFLVDTVVAVYGSGTSARRDTVILAWQFGRQRILHLEDTAAAVGTKTSGSDLTEVIFTSADSARTVYAVIRDELGYCVSNEPYELWNFTEPARAAPYLRIPPSDSLTSACRITRLQNPADTMHFTLKAALEPHVFAGVTSPYQERTLLLILANYSFDAVAVTADSSNKFDASIPWTGIVGTAGVRYTRGAQILSTDTLLLTAVDDTVVLKSVLRRDDLVNVWVGSDVTWNLSDASWLEQSSFPVTSASLVLKPVRAVAGTVTLTATYGTLSSRVYLRVLPARIDSFTVAYPSATTAGTPAPVSWRAVDANGNLVTDPSRQPDSMCLLADRPVWLIRGPGDTALVQGSFCMLNPFTAGQMTNSFYSIMSGPVDVTYVIYVDGVPYIRHVVLNFVPDAPDSIRIVHKADLQTAVIDTLIPFGTISQTQCSYVALLYDRYGNPITDASLLSNIFWSARYGGNLTASGNAVTYSAKGGYGASYLDTLMASYAPGGTTQFYDGCLVFVVPIARLSCVSTHEWVPDTLADVATTEYVLSTVLNISLDSLKAAAPVAGRSANGMYLNELRKYGYPGARDGFLDYLNIILLDSLYLRADFVTGIAFVSGAYAVRWDTAVVLNGRTLAPRMQSMDAGRGRLYRLWLIPHAFSSTACLETGFLPRLTFDNLAVEKGSHPPVRLGSAEVAYVTPEAATLDSAPPVIDRFLFINNKCNRDQPNNKAIAGFSEPVKLKAGLQANSIQAFALVNGLYADSNFTATLILSGRESNQFQADNPAAWDLQSDAAATMAYEMTIKNIADADNAFRPGYTALRFSVIPQNTDFMDLNGNAAALSQNRPETLEVDKSISAICNLSGLTVVDRNEASRYSWAPSTDPADGGDPVPLFHYFGFDINLDIPALASQNGYSPALSAIKNCTGYDIMGYDSSMVLVSSEVRIFDLLGNQVAGPATNRSLAVSFTVADVDRYFGLNDPDCSMSPEEKNQKYIVVPGEPGMPDRLEPKYPGIMSVGYDFMRELYESGSDKIGAPSWNCLNAKGRLVAPGGYIAVQKIRAGAQEETVNKKIIVTDKKGKGI